MKNSGHEPIKYNSLIANFQAIVVCSVSDYSLRVFKLSLQLNIPISMDGMFPNPSSALTSSNSAKKEGSHSFVTVDKGIDNRQFKDNIRFDSVRFVSLCIIRNNSIELSIISLYWIPLKGDNEEEYRSEREEFDDTHNLNSDIHNQTIEETGSLLQTKSNKKCNIEDVYNLPNGILVSVNNSGLLQLWKLDEIFT